MSGQATTTSASDRAVDDGRANARRIARSISDDPSMLARYRACALELCAIKGTTEPQHSLAIFLLGAGEWQLGWAEFAVWHELEQPSTPFYNRRRWDGRSRLDGKTLLVRIGWAGLGDAIQTMRFTTVLHERTGARIVLETHPTLTRLARNLPGVAQAWQNDQGSPPPFDCYTWLWVLPGDLGCTPESVAAAVPYLTPDPSLIEHWRQRLPDAGSTLRVGVVWGASAWGSAARNVPLAELAPLGQIDGLQLVSLQKSVQRADLPTWREAIPNGPESEPTPDGMTLLRLGPKLTDMADTAALMSLCDVIVTVDSAPAHLAGALDRPTLMMLRKDADWRWQPESERSPWLPSAKLIRQQRAGAWGPVVVRVAAELRRLVATRGAS